MVHQSPMEIGSIKSPMGSDFRASVRHSTTCKRLNSSIFSGSAFFVGRLPRPSRDAFGYPEPVRGPFIGQRDLHSALPENWPEKVLSKSSICLFQSGVLATCNFSFKHFSVSCDARYAPPPLVSIEITRIDRSSFECTPVSQPARCPKSNTKGASNSLAQKGRHYWGVEGIRQQNFQV